MTIQDALGYKFVVRWLSLDRIGYAVWREEPEMKTDGLFSILGTYEHDRYRGFGYKCVQEGFVRRRIGRMLKLGEKVDIRETEMTFEIID